MKTSPLYQAKAFKALDAAREYAVDVSNLDFKLEPLEAYLSVLWKLHKLVTNFPDKYEEFFDDEAGRLAEMLTAMANVECSGFDLSRLRLLSAGSFYVYGYPAAARLIARETDLNFTRIEGCLRDFLLGNYSGNEMHGYMQEVSRSIQIFVENPNEQNVKNLKEESAKVLKIVMESGSSYEVLFGTVLDRCISRFTAVCQSYLIYKYDHENFERWKPYINEQAKKGILEFWPSQVKTVTSDFLRNPCSIALQMPTSSGKTQSIQLLLFSHFLRNNTTAVIVVPFRALLREIQSDLKSIVALSGAKMEVIDDIKIDDQEEFADEGNVLVTTPEKLNYLAREKPDLIQQIGLFVFDEGHLFDDKGRGALYELLLTSIKIKRSAESKVVFISAVMPNITDVTDWLGIHREGALISNYKPTLIHTGVCQKSSQRRFSLYFKASKNESVIDEHYIRDFIEVLEWEVPHKRGRKVTKHQYPGNSTSSVAAAIALKSLNLGNVAVFTGQPAWTESIAAQVITGLNFDYYPKPISIARLDEVTLLTLYAERMLGADHILANSFRNGFAIHHGQLLQSFKEVVEDCVTREIVPLVICTSTLAEGVNMPIKTLVVHAAQKGENKLSHRDFLNLSGRPGRASKETSGNVIFVLSEANQRSVNRYAGSLNPEYCWSSILATAESMVAQDISMEVARKIPDFKPVFDAIESFLMLAFADREFTEGDLQEFFTGTFAFFQIERLSRGKEIEVKCFEIFTSIVASIEHVGESKKLFARTGESIEVNENLRVVYSRLAAHNVFIDRNMLVAIISGLHSFIGRGKLTIDESFGICLGWIEGRTPLEIHNIVSDTINKRRKLEVEASKQLGKKSRFVPWEVDDTTAFIQSALSYDLANRIGSLAIFADDAQNEYLKSELQVLQKKVKYGLADPEEISFFEIGISDRVLCQEVNAFFQLSVSNEKKKLNKRQWIRENVEMLQESIFFGFPSYFSSRLQGI